MVSISACKNTKMSRLNLPNFEIKSKEIAGKAYIFDILRQKYVVLTPEEWVRQHFVHYLIEHLDYPQGLMANEVELQAGEKRMRCDTVVYDRDLRPRMIIEYKKPDIPLTEKVFNQVVSYNILLHVEYLIVSNGIQHICCKIDYDKQSYEFLPDIPKLVID